MKTETEREVVRVWTGVGDYDAPPWSATARRATVMIESGAHEALAILVDDGGARYYRVANDRVASFIAAATQAWSSRGRGASLAVLWSDHLEAVKGGWPTPPPHPFAEDPLYMFSLAGHHQLLTATELAVRRAASALGDAGRAAFDAPGANRTEG